MPSLDTLKRPDIYPRTSAYDPRWIVDQCMGPHPLWLLEDLSRDCDLRPGMTVLDLGCGFGATSVFLAREFGVQVQAVEAWLPAADNTARFDAAGVSDQVTAVAADARNLPFDEGQFDAIIAIGSYHYFGTDDLYLGYLAKFLAPGGQLAIAVPSLRRELRELGAIPDHLRTGIGWEVLSFHTSDWWRFQWEQTGLVTVTAARPQPSGWADWVQWCEICAEHSTSELVRKGSADTLDMLQADGGELLTFALISGRAAGSTHR